MINKIYYAKTHADFLNQAFGTNYVSWEGGRWKLDFQTWVWMVRMDGKIRRGWRNIIINQDEIHELYVWNHIPPTYNNVPEMPYRIAVQIVDLPQEKREYRILGKYKFDVEQSTNSRHVLIKISDDI